MISPKVFQRMTRHNLAHFLVIASSIALLSALIMFSTGSSSMETVILMIGVDAAVNIIGVFLKFKYCLPCYNRICIIGKWRADSMFACLWDTVPDHHRSKFMGDTLLDT